MAEQTKLKVMVLAGGPDRERPVSLQSGAVVAGALRSAGHEVLERDILPNNLVALDEFMAWGGQVIFPVLHGAWGEGGPLQRILDPRPIPYVGCRAPAAQLCMDKVRTKEALTVHGLPTAPWQVVDNGDACTLLAPAVIKPPCEGSSIDIVICKTTEELKSSLEQLRPRHHQLLVERFIAGKELTVGVLADSQSPGGLIALPPIQIVPATEFYDYEAKYNRDDTRYLFDIDLPADVLDRVSRLAVNVFRVLGCRHMSRVDFIVDGTGKPWVLEVNTIPGFTSHSLLPMAAARTGLPLPALTDRLVRLALAG